MDGGSARSRRVTLNRRPRPPPAPSVGETCSNKRATLPRNHVGPHWARAAGRGEEGGSRVIQ